MSCSNLFSPALVLPTLAIFCDTDWMSAADLLLLLQASEELLLLLSRDPSSTMAPRWVFSSFLASFSRSLLTRPICILPRADWDRLDLMTGDLFFLKMPSLPLVGVVLASLEVELELAVGDRRREADSSRGVERSFETAGNFFCSLALGGNW